MIGEPESWDDKGMDWNAPDPANADYAPKNVS